MSHCLCQQRAREGEMESFQRSEEQEGKLPEYLPKQGLENQLFLY